jgi:hypothetical protein
MPLEILLIEAMKKEKHKEEETDDQEHEITQLNIQAIQN